MYRLLSFWLLLSSSFLAAQTYTHKVLYNFGASSKDGTVPYGGLVADKAGNFYGTTFKGGGSSVCSGGCGTVFKVTPKSKETILHAFVGSDGSNPIAGLVSDAAGNYYGLTNTGGISGFGTLFKITAAGKFSVLHQFGRIANDGSTPEGTLTIDSLGNLYGTTYAGGVNNAGTVFRVTTHGVETVLYSFSYVAPEGSNPLGNVARDSQGNLFGTTGAGGLYGAGILFEINTASQETVLYNFCSQAGCVDGAEPTYISMDALGNIFGETSVSGVVFQFSNGVLSPFYSFCLDGGVDCADGGSGYGPLTLINGTIYGTGNMNGTNQLAYSLNTSGNFGELYEFENFGKGTQPLGGLISDSKGNFYGTTSAGGGHGSGTVFELIKN